MNVISNEYSHRLDLPPLPLLIAWPILGALDADKWAVIMAVAGRFLNEVTMLQQLLFVMKPGVAYKRELAAT